MLKKALIIVSTIILIFGAIYIVRDYTQKNLDTNTIQTPSDTAPKTDNISATNFTLKDLNGNEVSLNDFKGKKVFLNFWATWCPPCKAEMPDIEKLYKENKDSDLVILAVNLGDSKDTVQKFINDNNYTFKVLLDTSNQVGTAYKINSIPTSFFINEEGNIVHSRTGAMSYEDMKNFIKNT